MEKMAGKKGLSNIETILSEGDTGLPDEQVDVVWMCDVFHEVPRKRAVLEELHRVLKREGILAIYDGMRGEVLSYTDSLYSLDSREGKLFGFIKQDGIT